LFKGYLMEKLDGKFHGVIVRDATGEVVACDQYVIFLAKDNAFPETLEFYYQECKRIGADQEQLDAIQRLRFRVKRWRQANPQLCKIPDAAPGECQ
jgi:hypothetical protein